MRFDDEEASRKAAETSDTTRGETVPNAPDGEEVIKSLIKRMREHSQTVSRLVEQKEGDPGYALHLDPPRDGGGLKEKSRPSDPVDKPAPRPADKAAAISGPALQTKAENKKTADPVPAPAKIRTITPQDEKSRAGVPARGENALASFVETNEAIRSMIDVSRPSRPSQPAAGNPQGNASKPAPHPTTPDMGTAKAGAAKPVDAGKPEILTPGSKPLGALEKPVISQRENASNRVQTEIPAPDKNKSPGSRQGPLPPVDNPQLRAKAPEAAPEIKVEPAPGTRPFKEPVSPNIPHVRPDAPKKQLSRPERKADAGGGQGSGTGGGSGGGGGRRAGGNPSSGPNLGQRQYDQNFRDVLTKGLSRCRRSLLTVGIFSFFVNALVLSIPVYLFQISDRVLTSRSTDTLIMLSALVIGFLLVHVLLDMARRVILMRVAVELETRLGPSVLSAAAKASQNGSNREYQTLGDLQQIRNFVTGPVLLTIFDIPVIPIYLLAVYLIHPQLGYIVTCTGGFLLLIALINQKLTAVPFGQANAFGTRANLQADAMSRNAQVINAMGMIPEGVQIWGRETMDSLKAQVIAQDRNVLMSTLSKFVRLCTQIGMLGWGAWLALNAELTGGMLIAASIVGSRALAPIEGAIEGWRGFIQARSSYARIRALLLNSPLNLERLRLPRAQGRVTVERVLYVPPPTKKVILNGISFHLEPGESMAIVGASGSGKSTLGRMLVGSIMPTAGNVRLDHMDLRNWDPRQFGESVGYLPQDVQLFPATIKANISRMREDATDDQIFDAAETADVHEMISQFAAGYETLIGVDGAPLSGGQKQRIGLARAFFGDPRMVVLDEPNSNLDVPGERALARALTRAKAKEITVIAITQRPSLLKNVDKIMLLKDGTVQAMGPRDEMMQVLKNGGTLEGGSPSLPSQTA